MNFIFHNIWDVILSIDELIFLNMVKTTNQFLFIAIMDISGDEP
jgi:hypothetical protein